MEPDPDSKEQNPGELLEQLSQMKIELARKQRKLKKCRRSEKVKAHVKQKIQEQAQLNGVDQSQNDLNRSLSSTLVGNSSELIVDQSGEHVSNLVHYTESTHNESLNSQQTKDTENRKQEEKCLTEQKGIFIIGKQSEKSSMKPHNLKSDQIQDVLVSHSEFEYCNLPTMKVDNKLICHAKQDSNNSQCCSGTGNGKSYADSIKLKTQGTATKTKHLEHSENRLANVMSVASSDVILKCPAFTSDNLENISPEILSGEMGIQAIGDQRDKDEHRFLVDSLAITPSFVSIKALCGRQDIVHQDSIKPWHYDSESDLTLRLGFDTETQLADDQSKDCISPLRNVVKDSKNVLEAKVVESKYSRHQFTDVQNDDTMTSTSTGVCDGEISESENICAKGHKNNHVSGCQSTFEQHDQQDTAGKSYDKKESSRKHVSSQTNGSSDDSHGSEMELRVSSFSENYQLPVDKKGNCIPESDKMKNQTSSPPSVAHSFTSVVGGNLQSRKRHQMSNFSECSRRKKIKMLDEVTEKSNVNNSSDNSNKIEFVFVESNSHDSGRSDICDASSPKSLNSHQACNKETAETQRNVSTIITKSINNQSDVVMKNSKSLVTDNADKVNNTNITLGDSAKDSDFSSETADSVSSDCVLSQSLLKPVLPLEDDNEINQKPKVEESLSGSLNENVNSTMIADKERMCIDAGSVGTQTENGKTYMKKEKTEKSYGVKKDFFPESQINENPHYTEVSISSSDESNQVMGEMNSENKNKSDKIGENYLDFTELDVIPFSQMELSESFLSNPEAYQILRMNSSSREQKKHFDIFIQRRSPRLTSSISGVLDKHDIHSLSSASCNNSQSSSSHSEQLVSNRTHKSRKSLIISSLFQFLVDEAKRKKSEHEFWLPKSQYGCLMNAKYSKTLKTETPKSLVEHLTESQSLNLIHECSEELFSQDIEYSVSNVCEIEAHKEIDLSEATVSNQNIYNKLEPKHGKQSIEIDSVETKHGTVNHSSTDSLPNILSPAEEQKECQANILHPKNLFPDSNDNFEKTSTEPHIFTCFTDTTATVSAVKPMQQTESEVTDGRNCLPLINTEVGILSPDRGSIHGDACLPTGCALSQCSPETGKSSQSSSETNKSSQSSSETYNSSQSSTDSISTTDFTEKKTKPLQKDGLRFLSCFQTEKSEPVLSLTSGSVVCNNNDVQFVACMSECSLSLWSSDTLNDWTNELDWLLPVGYCAKNLWLLPHQTKVALLISGLKDETLSWVLLFVYHWQTGESSRLNLDLPLTHSTNSRNSLLCCPLVDSEVILCCNKTNRSLVQKYSLANSLDEITSQQPLEDTQHTVLSLSLVDDLNLALVGLSLDSQILVWNHKIGTLLTQIDVTLILPSPLSLACVQAVKGYLVLVIMNRSSENPGCFLAINPQIGLSKLLFNFETDKDEIQSFKQPVVNNKIIAAIDEVGDIVLWDKYYGNLLARFPQSHSTALHFSEGLLFTGHETGCVHVMEIR